MKKNIKYIIKILVIGLIVFFINKLFIQICFVQGDSMYSTLKDGDMVLVTKYDLKFNYNDIVIIKKKDKTIIKRIVGLPKDKIKIDKYLYINGNIQDNRYIEDPGNLIDEITLKENEYFVLGDNIQHSIDSRFDEIGVILKNEIIGKIIN